MITKHQQKKIDKINSNIKYFCDSVSFSEKPIIEIIPLDESDTILIHVKNSDNAKWYETRIDIWGFISPRGKYTKGKYCGKSIYNKFLMQGV